MYYIFYCLQQLLIILLMLFNLFIIIYDRNYIFDKQNLFKLLSFSSLWMNFDQSLRIFSNHFPKH